MGQQFLHRALPRHLAPAEEVGPVTVEGHDVHIVGGDEEGDAQSIPQLGDEAHDLSHSLGVQPGGGFVQNHHLGLHGQHTGDGHPLFLAVGQGVGGFIPEGRHAGALHGPLHPAAHLFRPKAQIHRTKGDVTVYVRREELVVRVLEDDAHPAAQVHQALFVVAHRGIVHQHRAALRPEDSVQVEKQRGFARAVAS